MCHSLEDNIKDTVNHVLGSHAMAMGKRKQSVLSTRHARLLNLRTELFRPSWTYQRSTEKMRPNLIAMKTNFPKPDLNQARDM